MPPASGSGLAQPMWHLLLLLPAAVVQAPGKRWNILFIGTDQQRTSTLGCYGNDWAHSPNIDRLASQGVRFTDAYTVSPVCSPSRTSVRDSSSPRRACTFRYIDT